MRKPFVHYLLTISLFSLAIGLAGTSCEIAESASKNDPKTKASPPAESWRRTTPHGH